MLFAASRSEFPLFLHVLGAMLLTGSVLVAATALVMAWRATTDAGQVVALRRFGFRALLFAAIPAYIVMRVGAQWIESEEGIGDADFAWLGIGYIVADLGALLLIIATVLAGIGARKQTQDPARGASLLNIAGVIGVILVLADIVAIWAMGGKPT